MSVFESRPLAQARVFLSHSWDDNDASDALDDALRAQFDVLYDRRSIIQLGDSILPREAIVRSDFFLFLASESSMARGSMARRELELADASRLSRERRIGLVAVDGYRVPEEYADARFERLATPSLAVDANRIADCVERRLVELGGLRRTADGLAAGANLDPIVDLLLHPSARSSYPLAAVFQKVALDRLISRLTTDATIDLDKVAENLVQMFLQPSLPEMAILRDNAVYLLSRIRPGDGGFVNALRSAYPDRAETVLYRGFHVALGFLGDVKAMQEYVRQLAEADSPEWDDHRDFNARFHVLYYGSRDGALADLRQEVNELRPPNLLGLDVLTIGALSDSESDAALLDARLPELVDLGVEDAHVRQAMATIRQRVHERRAK